MFKLRVSIQNLKQSKRLLVLLLRLTIVLSLGLFVEHGIQYCPLLKFNDINTQLPYHFEI